LFAETLTKWFIEQCRSI